MSAVFLGLGQKENKPTGKWDLGVMDLRLEDLQLFSLEKIGVGGGCGGKI